MNPANTIGILEKRLTQRSYRKLNWGRDRASVAVVMIEPPLMAEPSVLLMQRSIRENDPWSGHMSFPGGRQSPVDQDSLATAQRELREETGLAPNNNGLVPIGRLSDIMTRSHGHWRPMIVTPHVFHLRTLPAFHLNHEAVETVWVPLTFLAQSTTRQSMTWRTRFFHVNLPCYRYQTYKIWGLTLLMLDELMAVWMNQKKKGLWWLK